MLRRNHPLRKGARRIWAVAPTPSSDISSSDQAAVQFFASLPSRSLPVFIERFERIPSPSLRSLLLATLKGEVESGVWGRTDEQLPVIAAMFKKAPQNHRLREVAEVLASVRPEHDVTTLLLTSPSAFSWWEDLFPLLPFQSPAPGFYYPTFIRECLNYLHKAICEKSLQVYYFLILRKLPHEQLEKFHRLLTFDRINDFEKTLPAELEKCFQQVDQIEHYLQFIREKYGAEVMQQCLGEISAKELRGFTMTCELEKLLNPPSEKRFHDWIRTIGATALTAILPISLPALFASFRPAHPLSLSDTEELALYQRAFLTLAFPQVLLHLHDRKLIKDWQLFHSLPLHLCIREMYYYNCDQLVAVFTRDTSEMSLRLPVECVSAHANSEYELRESIQSFMRSPSQRVYLLDYSFYASENLSLAAVKSVYEETPFSTGKLLCVVIRIPPFSDPISLAWTKRWKLRSCENVRTAFRTSIKSLKKWLNSDTKKLITDIDFTKEKEMLETVISRVIPNYAYTRFSELANDDEFCVLMNTRISQETKQLEFADWKTRLMGPSQEQFLYDSVKRVLIEELVDLLRPVVTMLAEVHAIPSFLNAPPNSVIRKFWGESFLALTGQSINGQELHIELKYPFALCDFYQFVCPLPGMPLVAIDEFDVKSVTNRHDLSAASTAVSEVLPLYLSDLVALDLGDAYYKEQGLQLCLGICGQADSFKKAMMAYCKHRELILKVCRSERSQGLDDFFASLFSETPGNTLPSPSEIISRLSFCASQLIYVTNPALRMYAIHNNALHEFSCVDLATSRTRLNSDIKAIHCSIILLKADQLLVCGGQIASFFRDQPSGLTYLIEQSNTVFRLPDMEKERMYHGLARVGKHVYAIGGSNGQINIFECEKLNLESWEWLKLPEPLKAGRVCFSPVVYKNRIYVFGGHAAVGERINTTADTVELLQIEFPGVRDCICVLYGLDTVILFSDVGRYAVNLETLQVEERRDVRVAGWSVLPPVLYNDQVFIVERDVTFKCFSLDGAVRLALRA